MDYSSVIGIVLAAGKGTRMKSDFPKVLHELFFSPMIYHVLDQLKSLSFRKNIIVTGHHGEIVEKALRGYPVYFTRQERQLGTGHAVLSCADDLRRHNGSVIIICGDTPLVKAETIRNFIQAHIDNKSLLTVMTTELAKPKGYGRIITDDSGTVAKIVEEKDASVEQRKIKEINAGIYCADACFLLDALQKINFDNKQGEYYLTDIVEIASIDGVKVQKFYCADSEEVLGVNSRRELAQAHSVLQMRYLNALMDSGVSILKPETVAIEKTVTIGKDSLIYPNVSITGRSIIGTGVVIDSFVKIDNSKIGDRVRVGSFVHLRRAEIPSCCVVSVDSNLKINDMLTEPLAK